jgi:hypothetical protein
MEGIMIKLQNTFGDYNARAELDDGVLHLTTYVNGDPWDYYHKEETDINIPISLSQLRSLADAMGKLADWAEKESGANAIRAEMNILQKKLATILNG